ncbi:DUF748 domain-containing protein [Geobacter sp. SVR]|uniref:DUF748 domain-containing protein n=1 Tax=Geobacter sp. SVR TaxID=2495594 RepID=UPI00143EF607|nr:DUF748 domain-containing protein [Geobacter sp. SVR]BCS52381.1 flagellar motor protein MotB [Geobacter sp. SVR]GCF84960.1 flagellar motor protein MotB [Geobacter sp. SVR]
MLKRKHILIAIGITTTLLLFTIVVLPLIVKSKAAEAIQAATGRTVRLGSVSINPFTLTVTVNDFAIDEKGAPPLIGFKQVQASLAPASLFKGALILSRVAVDTPTLAFARTGPNRYSFSDIIDKQQHSSKPEKSGPFLFSINNVSIKNGSLDFDDRAVEGGRKHTVRALQLAIPFISNIPYLAETYIDPSISATVNGAPFNFSGKLKPLSKSLETSVRIDLKQLSLPEYVAYSPVKPPADLTSGKLTVDTNVSYRISAEQKPELSIKGVVVLDDISIDLPEKQPLLRLPSLKLQAKKLDIFAGLFDVEALALDGLELFVSRDGTGTWMYSRLLPQPNPGHPSAATGEKKSESRTKAPQPQLSIASLACTNASIHFNDAVPKGGFRTSISSIDLTADNIGTAPDTTATYELSLLLDGDVDFSADGSFSVNPLSVSSSVELAGLKLQRGWPYLSRYLTAPVKGTLDLSALATFKASDGLRVEKGDLSLKGLSTRYGIKDGFDVALLQVSDVVFRQKENRLEIGGIRLSKGDASVSRENDGTISLLSLLAKPEKSPAAAKAGTAQRPTTKNSTATPGTASAKPLSYRLGLFQLDRFNLAFTDKTHEEEPRFALRNTNLTLKNLQGPKFAPASLRLSSTFGKDAPLKVAGDITPLPFRYKGSVKVGRLPIRDFEAYFPDNLNVFIIGGYLDTDLHLDVALKDGKPEGSFRGSAGVRAFHSIDALAEEDLLKWESLQFDEVQGRLEPFSLNIHQVALNNAYSRIVVRKDGSLNLQNLVSKPEPAPATTATAQPAQQPAVPPAPGRQISVDSVTIQDSTLSFTDNHLPQTFSSTFFSLGGRVSGLSSEESKFADLDLRGNLENHSPLRISGKLNPLRDDLFVDLKVSFQDIDLSPVTPYSGTYLGYTVDKGKLFLDLKYLIDKKQLNSENKVFIDQFTFGRKVESDKATSLPVRLAVALLKDRKGEIHLDLPVTGRTDDPQFSVWGVVGQMLKNLLVKAATSPFALLSSMMGSGQDFSTVGFTAGSSKLSPEEEHKLQQLAKALADRPALKVEIKGFVDREKDPEGYRQELLSSKLRKEKFLELVKEQRAKAGESAETVQIAATEYSRLLKAVYSKEKFPKPRNVLGLIKDLPDTEMRKLIIANTAVGENELQALARERSAAVMTYLVSKGGIPAERLFQKNDDIHKPPVKETARSRVEFNAIVQ